MLEKLPPAKTPVTRLGWSLYYRKRHGKQAEHLADWYYLLHLAFGD